MTVPAAGFQSVGGISASVLLDLSTFNRQKEEVKETFLGISAAMDAMRAKLSSSINLGGTSSGLNGLNQTLAQMQSQSQASASAVNLLSNAFRSLSIGASIGLSIDSVIQFGKESAKAAADFDLLLEHIRSNTGSSVGQMEQLRQMVISLGQESGVAFDDLAEGYQRVLNFVFRGAEATQVLTVSMQAAVATGAKTADMANLVAGTLHNYDLAGTDASAVTNMFIVAAQGANMTLKEYNDVAGRAISSGRTYGASLGDINAVIETLVQHQAKAGEGVTGFMRLISQVATPSAKATDALRQYGHAAGIDLVSEFSKSGIEQKGFINVLDDALRATGGNTKALKEIIPQQVAYKAALMLLTEAHGDLKRAQQAQADTQSGKLTPAQDGYNRALGNLNTKLGEFSNATQNLKIDIGENLSGPLATALDWATKLVNKLDQINFRHEETGATYLNNYEQAVRNATSARAAVPEGLNVLGGKAHVLNFDGVNNDSLAPAPGNDTEKKLSDQIDKKLTAMTPKGGFASTAARTSAWLSAIDAVRAQYMQQQTAVENAKTTITTAHKGGSGDDSGGNGGGDDDAKLTKRLAESRKRAADLGANAAADALQNSFDDLVSAFNDKAKDGDIDADDRSQIAAQLHTLSARIAAAKRKAAKVALDNADPGDKPAAQETYKIATAPTGTIARDANQRDKQITDAVKDAADAAQKAQDDAVKTAVDNWTKGDKAGVAKWKAAQAVMQKDAEQQATGVDNFLSALDHESRMGRLGPDQYLATLTEILKQLQPGTDQYNAVEDRMHEIEEELRKMQSASDEDRAKRNDERGPIQHGMGQSASDGTRMDRTTPLPTKPGDGPWAVRTQNDDLVSKDPFSYLAASMLKNSTLAIREYKSMGDMMKSETNDIKETFISAVSEMIAKWAALQLLGKAGAAGIFGGPVGAIAGSLGATLLGGILGGSHHRAQGGPVTAGQPYVVGEHRPELFVPTTSGYIVPSVPSRSAAGGAVGGGGGGTSVTHVYNVSVNVGSSTGDRAADDAYAQRMAWEVRQALPTARIDRSLQRA